MVVGQEKHTRELGDLRSQVTRDTQAQCAEIKRCAR